MIQEESGFIGTTKKVQTKKIEIGLKVPVEQ